MKKLGLILIAISFVLWLGILIFITFYSNNQFLNMICLFFGFMFVGCGIACGCEKIEN